MNRRLFGSLIVLVSLLAPVAMAHEVLRCESDYNRRHVCTFSGWGRVALSHQLSRTSCVEGKTWGRDGRNAVWVSDGCRAEFLIDREANHNHNSFEDRRNGYSRTVVCESDYNHRHECDADTRNGVRLTRQLSRTNCVLNQNWGYSQRGIWVSHGCRAEFQLGH